MNDITALSNVMWGEIKTPDNYGMYASYQSQMDAGHDGYAKSGTPLLHVVDVEPHGRRGRTPRMVARRFRQLAVRCLG